MSSRPGSGPKASVGRPPAAPKPPAGKPAPKPAQASETYGKSPEAHFCGVQRLL